MSYKFKLGRVVTVGFSSVLLLMVGIGIVSKVTTAHLIEANGWVSHTYQVERNLERITKLLTDAETGQRGFILTERSQYLEPYNTSVATLPSVFREIEQQIHNNVDPSQRNRLREIERLTQLKMSELTQTIVLTQQGKRAAALKIILSDQGKSVMDQLRAKVAEMHQGEEELLAQRQDAAQAAARVSDGVLFGGTTLAIAFGLGVLYFINREIVQPINQVSTTIASSSNEIATTVEQQERTASQQATSVNQTTTTMDELSASARQSAQQAETAAQSAQQVLDLAQHGNQSMSRTLEGMTIVSQQVGAVATQMMRLSDQMRQIANISSLVSDLANQTNMLALNAAVEAVRAGEQGKGFAVVAAEIRKLADESKRSAEQISALVANIQASIHSTVTLTEQSSNTAKEGSGMTQQTVVVFSDVTEAVNSMVLNIQQISLNAKQQAIAVQQVVQAMNSLNSAARETANGMSQTRVSTHQLNEAAKHLQTVV